MISFFKTLSATSVVFGFLTGAAYADQFDYLNGQWTPVTGPQIGAPILFKKAMLGWDAWFGWWGQTAITASNGYRGSHVKIEGMNGDRCFYYISVINKQRMAWNLRHAESGNCPDSVVLDRDPVP